MGCASTNPQMKIVAVLNNDARSIRMDYKRNKVVIIKGNEQI